MHARHDQPHSSSPQATFNVHPISRFRSSANPNPHIARPEDIGCFSLDESRQLFVEDERSLKYYYPCTVGSDLNAGFGSFRKWEEVDEHLDGLLAVIEEIERREGRRVVGRSPERRTQDVRDGAIEIVAWRGLVRRFMTLPYNTDDEWTMNATLFQNTIYIEEDFSAKNERNAAQSSNRRPQNPNSASQEMMSYWGYKFETLSTLPRPWGECTRPEIEDRPSLETSNIAQYVQIVRTSIKRCTMILGGEVDCVWDIKRPPCRPVTKDSGATSAAGAPDSARHEDVTRPPDQTNWVELKTNVSISSAGQEARFEKKLCNIWAQSYLLGVKYVVVGFRDQNGIVQSLQEIQTLNIPGMVQKSAVRRQGSRGQIPWDDVVCVACMQEVLGWLRREIQGSEHVNDTGGGVWQLKKRKGEDRISLVKVEEAGTGQILSEKFLRWRTQEIDASDSA